MVFRSTFDNQEPCELWGVDDKKKVINCCDKAVELQSKIDLILTGCASIPLFGEKFPELTQALRTRLQHSAKTVELPSALIALSGTVDKLKKGEEPLTAAYMSELCQTWKIISDHVDVDRDFVSIEMSLIREFVFQLASFIEKNREALLSQDLFAALFPERAWCALPSHTFLYGQENYLRHSLKHIDESFRVFPDTLELYEDMLPTALKCIHIASKTLFPPKEIRVPRTDKNVAVLKGVVESAAFSKKTLEAVNQYFSQQVKYIEATNVDSKFGVALEILNNCDENGNLNVPLHIALDAYCVVSENEKKCPQFFKAQAMKLCAKIESFDIEAKQQEKNTAKPANEYCIIS